MQTQRGGTTSSLLHIVAYEISSKSSLHPRSFFFYLVSFLIALFSPFLSVRFFSSS